MYIMSTQDAINPECGEVIELGLSEEEREDIGRQTKRVLDLGRVRHLETAADLAVDLLYYVDRDVSLENALLLCTRKTKTL